MAPGADPARGKIILQQVPDLWSGLAAVVDNLARYATTYADVPVHFGRSQMTLEDMIAIYYVGPEAYKRYGLQANDAGGSGPGGNGTVQEYLEKHVYPIMQSYNSRPGASVVAPVPVVPNLGGGGTNMASIWGNDARWGVSQDYGVVTPGIDQGIYAYGQDYGLPGGHPGLDIAMDRGTALYMPQGLSGTVTLAGGTPYFLDEDYGDRGTPGKGELRITLDNGDIIILGHTSAITVARNQRVNGGMAVALSGNASGGHLHLEVRKRLPDGRYQLVNPLEYFGGAAPQGGQPSGAPRPASPGAARNM
jgi:murein DD-endopeptidase MepM/ murein hydrolase activator NlpD